MELSTTQISGGIDITVEQVFTVSTGGTYTALTGLTIDAGQLTGSSSVTLASANYELLTGVNTISITGATISVTPTTVFNNSFCLTNKHTNKYPNTLYYPFAHSNPYSVTN